MLRKPPASPQEYKDLLRRRKWWFLVPIVVIPALVFLVSLRLPKEYRSEAMILVEPQKVPTEYVHASVTSDVTDRLQAISEEIMSRSQLLRVAQDLRRYETGSQAASDNAMVSRLRKNVTVDVIDDHSEKQSIAAFKIASIAPTAVMAQKTTQEISNLFIQENSSQLNEQASDTSQFINDAVAKAGAALAEQEQKIREFKAAHLGALPEQEGSNLALINQYQSLMQSNSESIDSANQQKTYLQSMLNISGDDTGKGIVVAPRSAAEIQLAEAQAQLNAARQKYTDQYPDVVRLRSEVAALQIQAKQKPVPGAAPMVAASGTQAVGQQLESQLVSTQEEIKARTQRQHQIETQLSAIEGRMQMLPAVQSEYADLNRTYQTLLTNYQALVEKQQSSSMAADLERHDGSEQFRVLDPATLPGQPAEPNLVLVNGAGFFCALILGVLLAMIAEMRDATLHDPEDLARYLDAPLIVSVPCIPTLSAKELIAFRALSS